ncbi:hypothetical protein GQ42DRAFT_22804 [Ramicandelaber brevisporus]|nr:hypothetical protein GQ42DRAFT_22804 [Ramicandelaber brevisporus]
MPPLPQHPSAASSNTAAAATAIASVVDEICPRVLVLCAPDVEAKLESSGGLCNILAPHGRGIPVQTTVYVGQGQPYLLNSLSLRFMASFDRMSSSTPLLDEHLSAALHYTTTAAASTPGQTHPSVEHPYDALRSPQTSIDELTPWYATFRRLLLDSLLPAATHESFGHPVACLLVASSDSPGSDPVNELAKLAASDAYSQLRSQSYAMGSLLTYYVVLHDTSLDTEPSTSSSLMAQSEKAYSSVRSVFGSHSCLMRLDMSEMRDPSADVATLRDFTKLLAARSIIPTMISCIRTLNDQVASSRRGLAGRLFSVGRRYFGSGGGSGGGGALTPSNTASPSIGPLSPTRSSAAGDELAANGSSLPPSSNLDLPDPMRSASAPVQSRSSASPSAFEHDEHVYPFDSAEAQMRKLADYCFMLKDYPLALSTYQAARRDYANDKALRYLAGSQEMIGFCKLMIELSTTANPTSVLLTTRPEYDASIEEAVQTYARSGAAHTFAVRSAVLYYELLKGLGQYGLAALALIRSSNSARSGLRGALLIEQAAYCFMRAPGRMKPAALRKATFHLVLAGGRYLNAGEHSHAIRCYKLATDANSGSGEDGGQRLWSAASGYLKAILGQQAARMGDTQLALSHVARMMVDERTEHSIEAHERLVRDLVEIHMDASGRLTPDAEEAVYSINLPQLLPGSVIMGSSTDDSSETATATAAAVKQRYSTGPDADGKVKSTCTMHETVSLHVNLYNPLLVPLHLTQLSLSCSNTDPSASTHTIFECDELPSLTIPPNVTETIALSVRAVGPGRFTIYGISFVLEGQIPVYSAFKPRHFATSGDKNGTLKDPVGQALAAIYNDGLATSATAVTANGGDDSDDDGDDSDGNKHLQMDIEVHPNVPQLSATFDGFPSTSFTGQYHSASILLRNDGSLPVSSISIRSDDPAGVYFTNLAMLPQTTAATIALINQFAAEGVSDGSEYGSELKVACELQPGESVTIPCVLRSASSTVQSKSVTFTITTKTLESAALPITTLINTATASSTETAATQKRILERSWTYVYELSVRPGIQALLDIQRSSVDCKKHIGILSIDAHSKMPQPRIDAIVGLSGQYMIANSSDIDLSLDGYSTSALLDISPSATASAHETAETPEVACLSALGRMFRSERQLPLHSAKTPRTLTAHISTINNNSNSNSNSKSNKFTIDDTAKSVIGAAMQARRLATRQFNLGKLTSVLTREFHDSLFAPIMSHHLDIIVFWSTADGSAHGCTLASTNSSATSGQPLDMGDSLFHLVHEIRPLFKEMMVRSKIESSAHDLAQAMHDLENFAGQSLASHLANNHHIDVRLASDSQQQQQQQQQQQSLSYPSLQKVVITVSNASWFIRSNITLRLRQPASADWLWTGRTTFAGSGQDANIYPGGSVTFETSAMFIRRGEHVLNSWDIDITSADGAEPTSIAGETRTHEPLLV